MEDVFQKLNSLYVLGENVLNLPDDFEIKPYVLMTQQTDSNRISANESDIHEYAFKSPNDVITYTSSGVTYDKFKTFAIKIVLGSASSAIIPKVKDLKAIALDF